MDIHGAMILVGFLLLCFVHQEVLDHKDLQLRLHRFYATMISKKIFSWVVITMCFVYERYWAIGQDQPKGEWVLEYLGFTATVFAIDVAQKHIGLKGKGQGDQS